MENKLRVLHITPDDKFFDGVFESWEKRTEFENKALFCALKKQYQFKYIKRLDVLEIYYNDSEVKSRLQRDDYDVVFLHSMPFRFYRYVTWIPKDRTVIWWGWGHEIYYSQKGLPPIVSLDLFKTKTQVFVNMQTFGIRPLKRWLLNKLLKKRNMALQRSAISRVDYYQPVVNIEMELIGKCKNFRAKEFYYPTNMPEVNVQDSRPADGDIMVGNSATPTNNHMDVLDVVMALKQANQKLFIPLSYGNERYRKWLESKINNNQIIPIHDFLPREEYFQIINNCSYAVYGTIRQQAMGNITYALSSGIKVFLYRDSVAYKCLTSLGYIVFSIEDMTMESLRTPLTKEQMTQNERIRQGEHERRMTVYHNSFTTISRSHNF